MLPFPPYRSLQFAQFCSNIDKFKQSFDNAADETENNQPLAQTWSGL